MLVLICLRLQPLPDCLCCVIHRVCQLIAQVVAPIYFELRDKRSFGSVMHLSLVVAFVIYM